MDGNDTLEKAAEPSTARRRLRRFRVPVLIVALFAVLLGTRGLNVLAEPVPVIALLVGFATAAAALLAYAWLSRTVELRPDVPELTRENRWSGLGRGMLVGSGAFVAVMVVIAISGGFRSLSWGSFGGFVVTLGAMASVAVNEELLFRGVVFRILEERAGTVLALLASSLVFGLVHLVNGGATLEGTLAIALQGGMMMGAAYVATRSLWVPIGVHFAWNLTESGLFSAADSGTSSNGLLHSTLAGPTALTGGSFGPEASLVALLVCTVPTALFLRHAHRHGRLRRRSWAATPAR
jgi:CAAX protease family protein